MNIQKVYALFLGAKVFPSRGDGRILIVGALVLFSANFARAEDPVSVAATNTTSTSDTYGSCRDLRIDQLNNIDFNSNLTPTENFVVRQSGSGNCDFFVTVDNGGSSSFSTRKLFHKSDDDFVPVQICVDASCSAVLKGFPEVSSPADILVGSFPGDRGESDRKELTFRPRLSSTDYQRYGDYESNFTMRLYQGTLSRGYRLEDTKSFRLRYRMNKRIDLSVVSTGAPFDALSVNKTLNFGALRTAQVMTFDLVLKFNAGYRVRLSSENGGSLARAGARTGIPYTLQLAGNNVSLSGTANSPVTVSQGSGVSMPGGQRLPGRVTIGTVGDAQAGTYQDAITMTVTTTE